MNIHNKSVSINTNVNKSNSVENKNVYIIFDLDETLGQFVQFGHFYNGIIHFYKKKPTQIEFFNMLDIYGKFFRPNLFNILEYIKKYKIKYRDKLQVLIFTNNQVGYDWVSDIRDYMEYKIQYKLFSLVIGPYKIKNKIQEIMRSTTKKTYEDLVSFIKCDDNTPIMFLDDYYYEDMNRENIIYLMLKPYNFQYTVDDLIEIYQRKVLKLKINTPKTNGGHYRGHSYDYIDDEFSKFIKLFMSSQTYRINKSYISHEDYYMSKLIKEYIVEFITKNLSPKSYHNKHNHNHNHSNHSNHSHSNHRRTSKHSNKTTHRKTRKKRKK